jgi:hypothetical protein
MLTPDGGGKKLEPVLSSMLETLTTIDVTDLMFGASITTMIAVALIALTVTCWEIADH